MSQTAFFNKVLQSCNGSSRLLLMFRLDGSVGQHAMRSMVDEVMEIVDLTDLQHSLVGTKDGAGLSMEQAKRLSIAVELVANPR